MKTLKLLFLILLISANSNIFAQTADIVDVTPDPRNTNAGTVTVTFSVAVTGVDKSDFTLTKDGTGVNIASLSVSGSGDTYTLDLASFTGTAGTYVLTLVATGSGIVDGSSNPLTADASDTWEMETTPPDAPTNLAITSDYGSSSTDGITNDQTLVISGTAEANSSVEVFIGGVSIGSVSANGTGVWSIDHTGTSLVAGDYVITAKATDLAGNIGATSAAFNIKIDLTLPDAPVVTGIRDDSGTNTSDGKTKDQTIYIDGTSEANSSVQVYIDGGLIGSTSANSSGIWSYNHTATSLAAGTYSITAKATDVAGNIGSESLPYSVTVDLTLPDAPVITGIRDDSGTNTNDGKTKDQTIYIDGTSEANSTVEVFFGGVSKGTAVADGLGDWSFDYTGTTLTAGDYAITAKATDDVGNISSSSVAYNITIDTTNPSAPVVTGIRDDGGSSASDEKTNDPTIYIDGTAEINSSVEVFIDGTSIGSVLANGAGAWTFDYTGTSLADGNYAITAKATDIVGNTGVLSAPLNITIDLTLPAAPSVTDISGTFKVDKTFSVSGEAGASFQYSLNNGSTWNNYTGPVTLTLEGTYNIIANQTDLAGNLSPNSATVTVTIDKTTQVPLLVKPAEGSASDANLLINFNLPEGPLAGSVKMKFVDAEGYYYDRIVTFKNIVSGVNEFTLNGENLASNTTYVQSVVTDPSGGEGKLFSGTNYNVTVEYKDALDNTVAVSAVNHFFYSDASPTANIVDITPDPQNTNAGTVQVSFSWRVIISEVNKSDFILTRNGSTVDISGIPAITNSDVNTAAPQTAKHFYLNLSSVTADPGTYVLTLDASIASIHDRYGNVLIESASDTWVNDQAAPTANIVDISPDPRNNAVGVVTVNFSESVTGVDITDFALTREGAPVSLTGLTVSGSADSYTLDLSTVTGTSGTYVLTVNSGAGIKDIAGNNLALSASDTWVTDATPPDITSISIQSNNIYNTTYAKVGDIVTLSFTANENIQNVAVLINGVAATTISGGPTSWTASREMKTTDTEGTVTFSIDYTDMVLNSGVQKTNITTGLNVEFYKNAPTLNSVTIVSNNTYNNRAKVGNTITLNFSSATKLSNVSVNLANHAVVPTTSNDKDWTATWTMVGGDSEGIVPFTINYTDKPGNPGAAVSTTSNSSKVKFDKTKPELNAVTITSNNTNPQWVGVGGIVTVSITSSENIILSGASIKGTAADILGSGKNWTASYTMLGSDTDGNVNFEITTYADSAGNLGDAVTTTTNSSIVTFDKTAPSLTTVSIVSDNADVARAKIGDLVKILFTADDSIVNVAAKVNTKNAVVTPKGTDTWEAEYPISSSIADGPLTFILSYKDLAGNNAQSTATTNSSKVIVDNIFPSYTSVSIYSNNANTALAKANDIITIDFVTSENIKTPAVTINGIVATSITGSLKNWTATRTVLAGETQGIIPISIDIQDSTGNTPTTRYSTTDGSKVTFDDSNPIISSITVPAGIFKVGDIIPVTIITDANSYTGSTVEVNEKPQVLINNGNNSYTVNYTVAENDVERSALAALPVNIVLSDAAGLVTSRTNANVSSGTITIDSKTPRIDTFTSNAEAVGIARIGSNIIFTLKTLIAETGLIVKPATYNGKTLNWTTADAGVTYTSTYTVAEGDPEHIVPLQLGDITLSDVAGNKDTKLLADYNPIQKQIYSTKPTIQITGSKTKCFDGLNETVTFQFTGTQPYDLWYTHNGTKYSELGITSSSHTIQIQGGTVSLDSLVDATTNRIYTAPANVTITVNPLPVVTFDITGSPYSPDSPKDELNKYVLPIDKRNGVYSGEGVGYLSGKYYFYPTIIPSESKDKNLEIIYIYTDALGCVGKDTSYAFVSSTPVNIPDLKTGYCNYSDPFTVTGVLPSGHTGVFELYNADNTPLTVGWSQIDSETLSISPQLLAVGTYKVTYRALRLPSLEETSFINKTFTIEAKKTGIAISGLAAEYCYNNLANDVEFTVSGVTFESGDKGHFTGSPVFNVTPNSHTAKFKYSNALANADYNVSYVYESVNGCLSDPVNSTIHINPLPELIFSLQNNYNFNQATIPLVGNQTSSDYLFSGEGVSRDTLFTSAARVGSPIIITYSYTDGKGCSSQAQQTTTIYKATETIGLSSVYCYEDKYIDITCTPSISDTITGTFVSKRNAFESTGKNMARYYLSRVGNGKDTVYYNYKIKGTDYSVYKEVLVDSIGQVQIVSNLEDYDYCKSETKVQLSGIQTHPYGGQGNFTYSGTAIAMLNRGSNAEIYPTEENPGSYNVTYTYTSNSGCNATDVKSINIYPVPVASFKIPASCPGIVDPVEIINTSSPNDETMEWLWSVEGQEFSEKDLTYKFQAIGSKKIVLTVKSSNSCTATKDTSINVGISAIADFDWDHDCNTGSPIIFTNKSTNGTVSEFKWNLNENTTIGTSSSFSYPLSNIGTYNVELIIKTIDGCTDSITKQLMIQPYIKVNDLTDSYYFENFDNSNPNYNWEAKGLTYSDTSRWYLGVPTGEIINKAYSGDNSWFTQLTDKQNIENSQVISPCFDLRGLKNPMIKLNIWSSSEYKRDGAVLQYSTDQGKTWINLGSKNEGINWFDSENIQSQPGGSDQYYGWNEKPMDDWKTARHSLNNLIENSNVRFRIAYAADGKGVSKVDGFAFDNVWIGNRNQNILFEYFTNTNLTSAETYYQSVRDVELNLVEDIIPIHYHTSYPAGDPIYEFYKNGPSSRVYYYGVSQVPYARANGNLAFTFPSGLNPTTYFKTLRDSIDVKSLFDPKVGINIGASLAGNTCNIDIALNTNTDLTGKSISLQCAVVKESLNINGKVYHNVLRNFIPSPGGTIINTKLGAGESQTINLTWTPMNYDELANAKIIAYVQDLYSNEIYQAEIFDLSVLTSIHPVDISDLVTVFPNPVNDLLIVNSEYSINEVNLYDISGRIIKNINLSGNQITIPVGDLKSGMYIVKGKTLKGDFVKKVIKF